MYGVPGNRIICIIRTKAIGVNRPDMLSSEEVDIGDEDP